MARKEEEKAGLLSPSNYDEDAPDVDRDTDTNGEDSEGEVFDDDYEEEELGADASSPGVRLKQIFKRGGGDSTSEKKMTIKERRASRRHRERLKRGELNSELVYDMEEGGQASQSPSRTSSESDLKSYRLLEKKAKGVG